MALKNLGGRRLCRFTLLFALLPVGALAQNVGSGRVSVPANANLKLLSEADMKRQTGGEEPLSVNFASNQSTVTGNQIGGIGTTGVVSANSLANNSGLTTLIANSGNQVVISQSTVVNVYLH